MRLYSERRGREGQYLGNSVLKLTALLAALASPIIAGETPASSGESALWKQFKEARTNNTEPTLPDFSYAGYKYGKTGIPDVKATVFDVTGFGAIADDDLSDQKAIQAAIDAAEKAGGGIVKFPAGRFLVQTESDPVETITINGSNIVLRGEGSGAGGTIIEMVRHFEPADPAKMYSVPELFQIRPKDRQKSKLASVTSTATRESFVIQVDDASKLHVGQRVSLDLDSKEATAEFLAPKKVHPNYTRIYENGVQILENHKIAKIDGNTITFEEPIHHSVDPKYGWELKTSEMLSEVGVEDICFLGNWNQDFVHHRSAYDDGAWSAMRFTGVADGWVRRCTYINWNVALYFSDCAAFSVLNVIMDGNKGHFGMHARSGYGVLGGYVIDRAGHHHGPSVGYNGTGTVYWRCTMLPDQRIDSHSGQPYATLLDRVDGGILKGSGGPLVGLPHHMRWYTLWNFYHPTKPKDVYDFWKAGQKEAFLFPIVVGLYGAPVEFVEENLQVLESPGQPVDPESLYEAQLELREAKLPEWVKAVRSDNAKMKAMEMPAHPKVDTK